MNDYLKKLYDENKVEIKVVGDEIKLLNSESNEYPETYAEIYIYNDSIRVYHIHRFESWLKHIARTLDEAYICFDCLQKA